MGAIAETFHRTTFTWLAYLMLGFYAGLQAGLGPIVPFLRDEFGISYSIAGLHLSAFALAKVLIGFGGERVTDHLGRRTTFWCGGAVMCAGTLFLVLGSSPAMTIVAAFVMGSGGSLLLMMVQVTLSDAHGKYRAIALTEANLLASVFTTSVPVLIGLSVTFFENWRSAFITLIAFWLMNFVLQHAIAIPQGRQSLSGAKGENQSLPAQFWLIWMWLFLAVGIEWSVVFWSAEFLVVQVGVEERVASAVMSVFFCAMIAGRYVTSRLTRSYQIASLLLPSVLLLLVGFLLLWQGTSIGINLVGLFIAGVGVANLYPLGLTMASDVGEHQINRASARVALAAGLAIMLVPQIMGTLADIIGLFTTFSVIFVLILSLCVMTIFTMRLR